MKIFPNETLVWAEYSLCSIFIAFVCFGTLYANKGRAMHNA